MPWGLIVTLVASGALVLLPSADDQSSTVGPVTAASAWPHVQQADISGVLPEGPLYQPLYFFDARVSVGTAPTPDGVAARLVLRQADGAIRQLRSLPLDQSPQYAGFVAAGDELVWAESTETSRARLWAANVRTGAPARQITADTGNAVFYDSQYDIVFADGRLYWAATTPGTGADTEIRSVTLSGGPVSVQVEPGSWALTRWPWLLDGVAGPSGVNKLRNLVNHEAIDVQASGTELPTCSPTWCRLMVMSQGELAHLDLAHPDGSGRRRIADGNASVVITDVVPLDRFEIFAEPDATTDFTGSQRLRVYDVSGGRVVDIGDGTHDVAFRDGVLWWATGDRDLPVWHTLDLRTA